MTRDQILTLARAYARAGDKATKSARRRELLAAAATKWDSIGPQSWATHYRVPSGQESDADCSEIVRLWVAAARRAQTQPADDSRPVRLCAVFATEATAAHFRGIAAESGLRLGRVVSDAVESAAQSKTQRGER